VTAPSEAGAPAVETIETPWRRLDPRMLVVGPLGNLIGWLPVVVVLLVTGRGEGMRLWVAVGLTLAAVVAGVIRWRTTSYRITAERVELRSGWLRRQRRSVPRDRIRTVDLTARLLHRVFGLSVVQVSAAAGGQLENTGLSLDAVSTAEGERLRHELLETAGPTSAPAATAEPAAPVQQLAALDWSWIRFAPLTFSSLAGIGAVAAAVFNLFDDLGVDPRDLDAVDAATDRLAEAPLWLGVALVGSAVLGIAVVGSMVLFAERWFDFRLTREPDGTLRVRRGLLTRRSLSVSERRLRGVEISEPLLLRAGGGAQCRALSTGLSRDDQGGALHPPAPAAEARRVASVTLGEAPEQITGAVLRRHPRAARRRLLLRCLLAVPAILAAIWLLDVTVAGTGWLGWAGLLVLPPVAVLVALDAYRNLGHALTARYVVSRRGSLLRRSVALQRAGVIGWRIRQSPLQRRAGLATLEAVTAAGAGGYAVPDLASPDAVSLADAALPGLLPRTSEP
jgi:putative membrane protein